MIKKYKMSQLLLVPIFLLNIFVCTCAFAENTSFDKNVFKFEPMNHSVLLGVWKSHGLTVPIEIKLSSLSAKAVIGTLKIDHAELKFNQKVSISKIPKEYTYKFTYQVDKPARVAGHYTFFPHLERSKMMRGIYTDSKGTHEYFTLYR